MNIRTIIAACLVVLIASVQHVNAAQIALVNSESGHAFLFNHKGNCYALLPSHVSRADRFTLDSPPPRVKGSGTVFVRDKERDLAIAYVEGEIAGRCTEEWQGLTRNLTPVLEGMTRKRGAITRLGPEGILDRTDVEIIEYDRDEIVVATTDNWAAGEIYQGTSGSILTIESTVAGIAQRSRNERRARFFRMDEFVRFAAPLMGGATAGHVSQQPITGKGDGSLGFKITGWETPANQDSRSLTALERGLLDRAYIAPWEGKPLTLEITLSNSEPVPLSSISLLTRTGASEKHTPPKTVAVQVDASTGPDVHWRSIGSRDMAPTGTLAFSTGGIFARKVRLIIQSVWFEGKAVRLDGIRLE